MHFTQYFPLIACCMVMSACSDHGDNQDGNAHVHGVGYTEWKKGPSSDPLSPKDALKTFALQDGLTIEAVAAEPLVQDPVAIRFDASGRMWIAEMTSFMLDIAGTGQTKPAGAIVIVEDTDDDGIADKRTVFLSGIALPRAIAHVKGGILFADNDALYFAAITGDKPGTPVVVDPTYSFGSNVEKKANGLLYGLDNWLYNAYSSNRYRTYPLSAQTPENTEEIYRNEHWKLVRAQTSNRGQWGISSDDYGRLYYNNNSVLLITDKIRANLRWRNKNFYFQEKFQTRLGKSKVYPARPTPGINRGYLPENLTPENKLKKATAASGPVIYRGDLIPALYGHAVIPEPSANLVTAIRLIEEDGIVTGSRFYGKQELLTSTDERFRPVNTYTAPDGSLYIVDMYRGIIQDRYYLTRYLARYILGKKLDKGVHMGRIYRVRSEEHKPGPHPNLENITSDELVKILSHANGWWRDTARRLLIERQDPVAITGLESLALKAREDYIQINALWTLEGLGALSEPLLSKLVSDPSKKVKVHAVQLAEQLSPADQEKFVTTLKDLSLEKTTSFDVAMALAASLGQFQGETAMVMLQSLLQNWPEQPIINKLALSGLEDKARAFINRFKGSSLHAKLTELMSHKMPPAVIEATHLTENEFIIYKRGQERFNATAACAGCHGEDGLGIEFAGPPLAGSEWVNGNPERLAAILIHGLNGPIHVSGERYAPDMEMPGLKYNEDLGMADLAAIMAYIRNSWGNRGSLITIQDAHKVNTQTIGRENPYSEKELLEEFGSP